MNRLLGAVMGRAQRSGITARCKEIVRPGIEL